MENEKDLLWVTRRPLSTKDKIETGILDFLINFLKCEEKEKDIKLKE